MPLSLQPSLATPTCLLATETHMWRIVTGAVSVTVILLLRLLGLGKTR